MEQYNVTGMSCAACVARVEKAVGSVEGVKSCAVSLLTNSRGIEGDATPEEIIKAVENAGYGASLKISRGRKLQRRAQRHRNSKNEKAPYRVNHTFASADVRFYGTYDVELAAASFSRRKSCLNGLIRAFAFGLYYGNQSEVLYKRI